MKNFIVLLSILLGIPIHAVATPWNLPQSLNTENTQVTFEVDSTWHLVKGVARKLEGNLWLEDPSDFRSLRAKVRFPISDFDTDNKTRDSKMRGVMHSEQSAEVIFEILQSPTALCNPDILKERESCQLDIPGMLTINKVTKPIVLASQIVKTNQSYSIFSSTVLRWADFGIEDPSILIAKLHEQVKISVSIRLNS